MLRVDILLSKDDKVPQKMIEALQAELEKRIQPQHPDAIIRVRVSSSKSIEISGCTKDEKEQLLSVIEHIFNSDEWLPE